MSLHDRILINDKINNNSCVSFFFREKFPETETHGTSVSAFRVTFVKLTSDGSGTTDA